MPFHASFDCLWCGTAHACRGPDDLEGWAQLCPDCVGRAGENGFLRFRLKTALSERARATAPDRPTTAPAPPGDPLHDEMIAYYSARAPEYDEFYLRRGRYERGPIHDMAWQVDLDTATRWLDAQPLGGQIVELAAGTGWWSPLLAQKGELWAYDAAEAPLDLARDRLLAHGLRAHLHVRDAWAEPERQVDAVFAGFWLSHVARAELAAFLSLVRRWLAPGGSFLFIDSRRDPQSGAVDHQRPEVAPGVQLRRLDDGREFRVVKEYYEPAELEEALRRAGFGDPTVATTSRFFLLGRAVAP
jgi:demethylmenaquinone methyltransferase/2-methoxy-6-polyprenyl-1,4-benzoquinol methylase